MAIRFMRKDGSMPNESAMAHMGKSPASSGLAGHMGPGPLLPPPAPEPELPAQHPMAGHMLPWLLMAALHKAVTHGAAPKASGGQFTQKGSKLPGTHPVYSKAGTAGLPKASAPSSAVAPAAEGSPAASSADLSPSHASHSLELPASQGGEAVAGGPAMSAADPISRAADAIGRAAGSPVYRSKLDRGPKSTGLVRPAERSYQRRAVQQYTLKRPQGL